MRLKPDVAAERVLKRGEKDSISGKTRLSAYFNLISNEPINSYSKTLLKKGSEIYWSGIRSTSLRSSHEDRARLMDASNDHRNARVIRSHLSHFGFREYDRGYDLLSNKPRQPPANLPPPPKACGEILFGDLAIRSVRLA